MSYFPSLDCRPKEYTCIYCILCIDPKTQKLLLSLFTKLLVIFYVTLLLRLIRKNMDTCSAFIQLGDMFSTL